MVKLSSVIGALYTALIDDPQGISGLALDEEVDRLSLFAELVRVIAEEVGYEQS